MLNEDSKKILKDKPSPLGKFLYKMDRRMHNLKFYIRRHNASIQILFLLIYTGLNLGLAYFVQSHAVSIFIIVFLFFLGLERITIYLKSKIDMELIEKQQGEINNKYINYVNELEEINRNLKDRNNILERQNDALKLSPKSTKKSKDKR